MAGPPPQEQIDRTLQWVTDVFGRYYAQSPPEPPARFGRREFGFLWTGKKFFLRHTGFSSREAFHDFLAREAPHHAYYSTAYYKTPHASTMKEKEWLGADLIFDLDADHLPNADKLSYEEQLAEVHKQARKLLHEFLLGDFGFDPEHVRVVFSGGRGYHFHVTDPRVLTLDSAARREIVDYLSPNEQMQETILKGWVREKTLYKDDFGQSKKEKFVASARAPGWEGQLTRATIRFLQDLQHMPHSAAVKTLTDLDGIGPATAEAMLKWAFEPDQVGVNMLQRMKEGARFAVSRAGRSVEYEELDRLAEMEVALHPAFQKKSVIANLFREAIVASEGETDEPVTADIKRLIRLPGSLHGKTGLRVTPMSIEAFDRFDPLRDAVALPDEPARVIVSKPSEVALLGKRVKIEPGEQDLPLHTAMFLVLRRAALRPMEASS